MREAVLCPHCGKTVPVDAPQGLCPACMMQAGLGNEAAATDSPAPEHMATLDERATPWTPALPGVETLAPRTELAPEPMLAGSSAVPAGVPGYEILGELGRGGMGVVYKARQNKLQRIVALKMILAGGHAGSVERTRFRTEAEAIARLQHLNIVQVHEIGEHEGKPFFSLEFCAGGSLAQKVTGTPWRPQDAAQLVETLARAMEAAHQKGVIHRDLKPANILLLEDGTPKITDFGLARKLDEASQTQSGAVMGTPNYMAPEQASGKGKEIGPATDVHALGAILYELLTGRPPFLAATALDTVLQVVSHDPVPLRQLQANTPRDLETICLKCLQKEPARRYASAQALAEDLRCFQANEPIRARPVGLAERARKWVRRRPVVAGLLAAVCLVTLAGLGAFAWAFGQTRDARDEAINEQKKTAAALKDTRTAKQKAEEEKTIAEKARLEAEAATKEKNRQLLRAETLVVQAKFEHAFHLPEEKRAVSMLSTAALLREAIVQENGPLRDSLGLHLGSWSEHVHHLKGVLPHGNSVWAVAFSPDGKTALTASADRTAQLWETSTGKPLGPPLQHKAVVSAVAFSPDGKTVLTGSDDSTAQLWDAATGKPIGPPLQHEHSVKAVAFSPDGAIVLTGSWDRTARLWETATGKQVGPPLQHRNTVKAVAFSPNGKTVLTGSGDATARLWETATGKPFGLPMQHQMEVMAVAFSPDGKTVLTGSGDATARLWDAASGNPIGLPLQHRVQVGSVAFSPDGKTFLTRDLRTVRLWETATGRPFGRPLEHQALIRAVAYGPDGKTVLTGSEEGVARLWDVATGALIGRPLPHQDAVTAVAFSPDGKQVLTASQDRTARVWELAMGKPTGQILQHRAGVRTVAFSPDNKSVLTGTGDNVATQGEAQLWETATRKPLGPPLKFQHWVMAVAFSPDGKTVLTLSGGGFTTSGDVHLWDWARRKPLGPALKHTVGAVALSADGKTVLTAGKYEKTVQLWDTATLKAIGPLVEHQDMVFAVALSPDGNTGLTGGRDNTARLWETTTGKPIGPPMQHQNWVMAVALSPEGKTVLTGSLNRTARLWDTTTRKPLGPPLQHQNGVVAVAFSPDGKTVLTGSHDQTARLWETATGKPLGPPLQHQDIVHAVAFSPDGRTALTASADRTARLWPIPRPLRGAPERILLWTQVITGLELDEYGQPRVLDGGTWQHRRQQLEKLGGPPQSD